MKHVLTTLWQLPQTILGWIILLTHRHYHISLFNPRLNPILVDWKVNTDHVYIADVDFSISLGNVIILSETWIYDYYTHGNLSAIIRLIRHEQGHRKQSLMLGPLYLLIVGLPSAIRNALTKLRSSRSYFLQGIGHDAYHTYYQKYPEKWADRLGGVDDRGIQI